MRIKPPSLTVQILLALLLGGLLGWVWPSFGTSLQILSTIFIRLVLVIIGPLIFSTLVTGIAGQEDLRRIGGMALQTVSYFFAVTALALVLGFGLSTLLQPGRGVMASAGGSIELVSPPAESFWIRLFPTSIVDALARTDVLQIVVFSILFGAALSRTGNAGATLLEWCRTLSKVMLKLTDLVMRLAPVGVFGAAAAMVARHGLEVGETFLRLILVVYLGLGFILLVVFPILVWSFRIPAKDFIAAVKEPTAITFGTSSQPPALPKAFENLEAMGVPRQIAAFVLSTGLSLNLTGSTVFLGAASLFVIQAFEITLDARGHWMLLGTLFVASKGVANVPRASLVVLVAGLTSIGVPAEVAGAGSALLLGIDPILDMPRSAVNILGNCLATALVARWQGSLEKPHTDS